MSLFISEALANSAAPADVSPVPTFLMMGVLVLFFYFMVWRPQSKRQKEHRNLMAGLDKGNEVIISGGLMGKVLRVDEQYAVLEIANNVQVKVQKASVVSTLPKGTLKEI